MGFISKMPVMLAGVPLVSAVADAPTAPAFLEVRDSTLAAGLHSVCLEVLVLLVFLATFSVTRRFMKSKDVQVEGKGKRKKRDPAETASAILDLCQDQFTRGLRLYRELVRSDQDKELTEPFYIALVEAAIRVNTPDVAEQVVARMLANGMALTPGFVQSVMKLFAARKLYAECLRTWEAARPEPQQVILSCAVSAAAELGQTDLARELLAEMQTRFDVSTREWLPLVQAHVRKNDWPAAVAELRGLLAQGLPLDNLVFNTVLAGYEPRSQPAQAAPRSARSKQDSAAASALPTLQLLLDEVGAYAAAHPAEGSTTVDIVSYNTMLKALSRCGDVEGCFAMLEKLVANGVEPDDVSFSTLLDACIDEGEHQLAAVALERMRNCGLQMNCVAMTTLMKGFIRTYRLDKAMNLYDSMRSTNSQVKPDMITYSLLIKAHCDKHDMATALRVLEEMLESECCVDDVVFTHLIEGCVRVGNVRLAEKLFADMQLAGVKPSIYTLTGLVKIYGRCGMTEKAVDTVCRMEQNHGLKPTVIIFTCLVSGLLYHQKYDQAWFYFCEMRACCKADSYSTSTMLRGLADGRMWAELMELATQSLENVPETEHTRGARPVTLADSLNYCLNSMLTHRKRAQGKALYSMMKEQGVVVTVTGPSDPRLDDQVQGTRPPWAKA